MSLTSPRGQELSFWTRMCCDMCEIVAGSEIKCEVTQAIQKPILNLFTSNHHESFLL